MTSGLDEMRERLEALKEAGRKAERQMGDFSQMSGEISGIQAVVTSPDKAVTVTTGPGGSVTGIDFTQNATKLTPSQLSSTVMTTLQQAVAEAARKQAEIVQQYAPDTDVLERVLRTQEEMFGAPPQAPATPPRQAEPAADDYDETPDSFLEGGN